MCVCEGGVCQGVCLDPHSCPTLCNLMDCNLPGSSVHGIFQSKYWSRLPFPSPGDFPNPEIKPTFLLSPALAAMLRYQLSHQGSPHPQAWMQKILADIYCSKQLHAVSHLKCSKKLWGRIELPSPFGRWRNWGLEDLNTLVRLKPSSISLQRCT